MEEWDEYELPDRRGERRSRARSQKPPDVVKVHRDHLLNSLYHRGQLPSGSSSYQSYPEYLIPGRVAQVVGMEVWAVAMALMALAKEGFVQGPLDLPKREEDGSPIRYRTDHGMVEWDGKRWVTSIDRFRIQTHAGRKRLPKKEIQRQVKAAERTRKPSPFDGRGFFLLEDGAPYLDYGRKMGFFQDPEKADWPPETSPRRETCKRCLCLIEYRSRHGKLRRDHGRKKCDLLLVKRIMEE